MEIVGSSQVAEKPGEGQQGIGAGRLKLLGLNFESGGGIRMVFKGGPPGQGKGPDTSHPILPQVPNSSPPPCYPFCLAERGGLDRAESLEQVSWRLEPGTLSLRTLGWWGLRMQKTLWTGQPHNEAALPDLGYQSRIMEKHPDVA